MYNTFQYNSKTYNGITARVVNFSATASIEIVAIKTTSNAITEFIVSTTIDIDYNIYSYYYFQYREKDELDWIDTEKFYVEDVTEKEYYNYLLVDLKNYIVYEYRIVYVKPNGEFSGIYYGEILEFMPPGLFYTANTDIIISNTTKNSTPSIPIVSEANIAIYGYKGSEAEWVGESSIVVEGTKNTKSITILNISSTITVSDSSRTSDARVVVEAIAELIIMTGFTVKHWTGSEWDEAPLYIWDGLEWLNPRQVYVADESLEWKRV